MPHNHLILTKCSRSLLFKIIRANSLRPSKALITRTELYSENGEEITMCEFNVILNGKTQFKDAVYAKVEGNNITVKSILGEAKVFKNCNIIEVDVNATRLVLAPLTH